MGSDIDSPDWMTETLTHDLSHIAPQQILRTTVVYHPQWSRVGDWNDSYLPPITPSTPPPKPLIDIELSRQHPSFQSATNGPARDLNDPYLSRRGVRLEFFVDGSLVIHRDDCPSPVLIDHKALQHSHKIARHELQQGVVLMLAQRIVLHLQCIQAQQGPAESLPRYGLVGNGHALNQVRAAIQRLAGLDLPVLIRGESGTGKELVARALHQSGPRHQQRFIAVNAAAIPASLAAAEIFGATKGAFTGSHQNREGYLAQAHGGSLFLDEVGDLPAEVQTLLLRVLETHQYQSLGSSEIKRFNARLIAATDVDLEAAMAEDRFRSSLYHRLSAMEIRLPALREQRQNLGILLYHLLQQEAEQLGVSQQCLAPRAPQQPSWFPAQWLYQLALADWPGNIRQLRNFARQILLLGHHCTSIESEPQLHQLVKQVCQTQSNATAQASSHTQHSQRVNSNSKAGALPANNGARRLRDYSDDELLQILVRLEWRLLKVATELQVPRSSLYDRIQRSPLLKERLQQQRQR